MRFSIRNGNAASGREWEMWCRAKYAWSVCEFVSGAALGVWICLVIFFNPPRHSILEVENGFFAMNLTSINEAPRISVWEKEEKALSSQIRIFCAVVIITNNRDHLRAINHSYAKRCDHLIFFTSASKSKEFDLVLIRNAQAGTWPFFLQVLKHMDEVIKTVPDQNKSSWLLIIDDMTYAIIDNLRIYLSKNKNASIAGRVINEKSFWRSETFLDFNAGVVIYSEVITKILPNLNSSECKADDRKLRYAFSECFGSFGVSAKDAADPRGGHRFLAEGPRRLFAKEDESIFRFLPPILSWQDPAKCCSDLAITFGSLPPYDFYLLEYLIYRVRPCGIDFTLLS